MSSRITTLAQAVTDAINAKSQAGEFVVPFTAIRIAAPNFDRTKMKGIEVLVCPASRSKTLRSHRAFTTETKIDIGIYRPMSATTGDGSFVSANEKIDRMVEFVEQLADAIQPGELAGSEYTLTGIDDTAIYDPDWLRDGFFASAVRLNFIGNF